MEQTIHGYQTISHRHFNRQPDLNRHAPDTMKNIFNWVDRLLHSGRQSDREIPFVMLFRKFQEILSLNNRALELIAEANDKLGGQYVFDKQYIHDLRQELADLVRQLIDDLEVISPHKYIKLHDVFRKINNDIEEELAGRPVISGSEYVMSYDRLTSKSINLVGDKNARLAEIGNTLGFQTPDGFAITTRAFQVLLEENGILSTILEITDKWRRDEITVEAASRRIRSIILMADIPYDLKKAIQGELKRLRLRTTGKNLYLAVRSSAWGEDSVYSFAGQYLSRLNVAEDDLFNCYREIVASLFSISALEYRRQNDFDDLEIAMSVACQPMVDARISGVLYTTPPTEPKKDGLMISAAWGLGGPIVSGETAADHFLVDRKEPHQIKEISLVHKAQQLVPASSGGTRMIPVEENLVDTACLHSDEINRLVGVALQIEQFYRSHMDIEFTFNQQDELVILQARPLKVMSDRAQETADITPVLEKFPVLMEKQGVIAQKGIAAGKVYVARKSSDLDKFPSGAILVVKYASPLYARVMNKAAGIITDVGSATCHMATIAREFRVPTLVNTGNATEILQTGEEITVDAEENIIYQGIIDELCHYGLTTERIEDTYEYRLLGRVLQKIEPLHLLEPEDRNFTPEGCSTFHDIIRFVHEKAVEEFINLHYSRRHDPQSVSGRLRGDIPLDLVLIDIGGGLISKPLHGNIEIGDIASIPMQAMLEGLNTPGAWDNKPLSVDMKSFMSSLTRTFAAEHTDTQQYAGQNLAVISKEYANISLRLGYHFSMIDAYVSENLNDNYVYFRFVGGVTDETRRARRANLLNNILSENDFLVEVHGDLVVARIKKLAMPDIQEKIRLLGRLVGYTRQLDVQLTSDRHIGRFITGFENLAKENTNS